MAAARSALGGFRPTVYVLVPQGRRVRYSAVSRFSTFRLDGLSLFETKANLLTREGETDGGLASALRGRDFSSLYRVVANF